MTTDPSSTPDTASGSQRSDAILTALAQANQLLFSPGGLDEQLPEILAILGNAVTSDRVYLYENTHTTNKRIAHQRAAWTKPGDITPPEQMRLQTIDYGQFDAADVACLQDGIPVYGRAPEFATKTQATLTAQNVKAMAVVPIFSRDRWWGLLGIDDRNQDRIWSTAEIEALKNVAASLGAAIENDRLYTAEKTARQRAEMLHHVASIITASLDRDVVLQRCLDQLSLVLSFDSASIYLLPQNRQPRKLVVSGHADPTLTISTGLETLEKLPTFRKMMADHLPILSRDVRKLKDWVWMEGAKHVRSFMAAPLLIHGQMIGTLMVDSHHPDFYDAADLQIISSLAQTAAVAVQNAKLHRASQQQAEELSVLHQVALMAATAVTVDDLLTQTTNIITQTIYPNHFGFLLKRQEDDFLMPHSSYQPRPAHNPVPAPLEGSLVGRVTQTGKSAIVADITQDPDYFKLRDSTRSEIAIPVIVGKDVIGVINVESAQFNAFDQKDLRFLTTLSQLVASFIERTRLYQSLRHQADTLAGEVMRQTAELQQEKDRLQTILDSAGEAIIITDKQGIVQYANPALSQITGFSQSEILGKKSNLWRSNKTSEETYQTMWQTILRGSVWHGELVNRTKLGMHYDASLTVAPIYNEQGEMTGFVGIQSDISRLKNVDRLKSQFITDVSHELRTPVTNLKLYTDLLMRTPAEKHGRYIEVLQIQVSRLEQIIEDILTLSRLEGNRLNLEPNPVDINMIAAQSVKTLQSKAKAAGLAVNFMPYPSAELVCGEPALLRQLINNLAQNAINYTPKGKVDIIISQPPDSGFVELVVKDTGAGIDAKERPFIFDRFFRGKIASHSNISGSGLGLTIVREIVELLDGKIELESELGKGTKVTVRLKTVAASRLCH